MTIWVDADALPRAAKSILYRAARTRGVELVFVANGWLESSGLDNVDTVVVPHGPDEADDHIADHIEAGDLCITADIPLAARVVDKGAMAITPHGRELDEEIVGHALSLRDFHTELREAGVQTSGPAPYDETVKQRFANALDRWITSQG